MSFGSPLFPWWLGLVTTVLLAIAFALDFTRRRRVLEQLGDSPQLMLMMASLSRRRRALKAIVLIAALTLCVIAVARPQIPGKSSWSKRGIDLVVVMDFSKSMLARDVYPSRFGRMTQAVEDLLDSLDSDRVSLVVFAGAAAHFPLTHDHEAARSIYRGLSPLDMPPGSDLGEAIMVARCIARPDLLAVPGCQRIGGRGRGGDALRDEPNQAPRTRSLSAHPPVVDRARAIVVFTDGEDTEQRAHAEVAQAVKLGVDVFIVGVGTTAGELIPEFDATGTEVGWKKRADGSFVTSRLDRARLLELSRIAGGEGHYVSLDESELYQAALLKRLQHLKKGDLDRRVIRHPKEVYHWFLFPGFLLLLIEACMSERRRAPRKVRS